MSRKSNPELFRQWQDRLRRFEDAGLTVAEFCQLEGFSVASFYQWRRKLAQQPGAKPENAFVPVEVPLAAAATQHQNHSDHGVDLRIELPGGGLLRLDLDTSDAQQSRLLRNVVQALREAAR